MVLTYEAYMFDLYGTLVDIRTDEQQAALWEKMAGLYACCGAVYAPEELHKAYLRAIREKERALGAALGTDFPEIDLGDVFWDLLQCAPKRRAAALEIHDRGAWVATTAYTFRSWSRDFLRVFPGTIETLQNIRRAGGRLYLLSNAQALFTVPELIQTGLLPQFDRIYISSDAGFKKPEPRFMEKLLAAHGLLRERCVMVGNEMASDIGVAARCGVPSVFLNTGGVPQEEQERQIRALQTVAKGYRPRVIQSGKISELL